MKRFEFFIALLLIPLDFLTLLTAAFFAYVLRFDTVVTQYRPVLFEIPLSEYLQYATVIIIIWMIIFALSGLYTIGHPRKMMEEAKKIFVATMLGFASITMVIFLRGELFDSRFIVLAATIIALFLILIERFLVRLLKFAFYRRNVGVRRVVLVGNDQTAKLVKRALDANYRHGFKVVKTVPTVSLETLKQLSEELPGLYANVVIQADVNLDRGAEELVLDFARDHHLKFAYVADLFDTKVSNTEISTIGDIPLVEIKQTPLDGWGRIVKRTFDIIVGSLLLLLASPIMLIVALVIKLDSRGPVFYQNERVGKGGKHFFLFKFRRFKQEFNTGPKYDEKKSAEHFEQELISKQSQRKGPIYKVLDDPRNTRVGKFLEKTSLDELPQFINVIKGDMSLVGPRPHQPREVEGYKREHKRIFVARPGITGLAQISGRSDLDYDEEARLDVVYIENWSLKADIAILLKTPLALLKRHK